MSKLNPQRLAAAALTVVLTLAGCAGPWTTASSRLSGASWSVTPPAGWMHMRLAQGDMYSKDGPFLAYILIQSKPLTDGFHFTRRRLTPTMLPHEAAEVIGDNMRADPGIRQLRVVSSQPATIGGRAGFRLTFRYLDPHGIERQTLYDGLILPDTFISLRYTAARRHYFDSQLPAFNRVVESLRIADAPN